MCRVIHCQYAAHHGDPLHRRRRGPGGRRVLRELLPGLRDELAPDFVVVNGENAAGGLGITPKEADELFRLGVDAITLGNHTYRHREIWPYLEEERRIVRPYNYLRTQPGRGTTIVERDGVSLGVVNLCGIVHLQAARRRWSPSTRRCARSPAATTSWSTCTPRSRARRSRSAGTWTAR